MSEKNYIPNFEHWWATTFSMVFALTFYFFKTVLTNLGYSDFVLTGMVFGLGAMFGFGLDYLIKNKSIKFKITTLIILVLVNLSIIVSIDLCRKKNQLSSSTNSCEICGYISLNEKTNKCEVCGERTFTAEKEFNPAKFTKEQWLRDNQLIWFGLEVDSVNQKVDFYNPKTAEGFKKNPKWKPAVTREEVLDYWNE